MAELERAGSRFEPVRYDTNRMFSAQTAVSRSPNGVVLSVYGRVVAPPCVEFALAPNSGTRAAHNAPKTSEEKKTMAFLTPDQLKGLAINRMIFHVVGPEDDQLVLLEEMAPGAHTEFFLERIRTTNNGLKFEFLEASPLLASLKAINDDASIFAHQTQELAKLFHAGHGRTASRGVFMVFALSSGVVKFFALIKYDHETVLSYKVEETESGRRAAIAALQDTFVKSPEALQKSALIRLDATSGELCIRDRSEPSKISKYFRAFVGARRCFDPATLTSKLADIAKKVALANDLLLGPSVMRSLNQSIYSAIQAGTGFDPSSKEPFLVAVYGVLSKDSKVREDFDRELKREGIDSEVFDFEKTVVPRPAKKHLVTHEGIEIIWDRKYEANISRKQVAGGKTLITIETGGVRVEDDYCEPNSRRR